jgi:cold shock CspA family protein
LKREHPTSHGIYWERKPPLPPDEDLGILGWPHVLREYAHHIVDHALAALSEEQKNYIVDDLLRTNMIAKLVNHGRSIFIQIPSSESAETVVVELFEDSNGFDKYLDEWINRILDGINAVQKTVTVKHVLLTGGIFGYDRFKKSQQFTGCIKRYDQDKGFGFIAIDRNDREEREIFIHCSSIKKGSPQLKADDYVVFDIGKGKKGDEAQNVEIVSPFVPWLRDRNRITISPSLLALGARECLLRLDTEGLTWQEWLPELSLELIRDGHYGELQLLDEGMFIDPFLGKKEQFTIPEKLTLQSGKKWFSFPLRVGRQNRRPVAWEARIESSAFPLDRNIEVELQLSYRYGLENSYELSIVPVEKTNAPFERIVAKWMKGSILENTSIETPSSNKFFMFQSSPWQTEESEKFVSATESLARIDDEKFGRFLVAVTRSCWSQGRSIATASPEVQRVFLSFRDRLLQLVSQSVIQTVQQIPRALEVLVLLHVDAPTELIQLLLHLDDSAKDDESSKKILNLMGDLVGDGCSKRAALLKRLLYHLERHTNSDTFNPALAGMSIRAISNAASRHPQFTTSLIEELGAVKLIIGQCQRSLNNLLRKVPSEITTENKRIEVERRDGTLFRDTCELLLALLRIDQSNPEVTLLKPSSLTAYALAKVIRQLDARFVATGIQVHWRVRLDINVDEVLHRMSPVAFTLNTYLAEGAGSNLVQIGVVSESRI